MTNCDDKCLEKAVVLGNLVLESEVSKRLADARAAYEAGEATILEYQKADQEYHDFANSVISALELTIFGSNPSKGKPCGGCGKRGCS